MRSLVDKKYTDLQVQYSDQTIASGNGNTWFRVGSAPLNAVSTGTGQSTRIGTRTKMVYQLLNADCVMVGLQNAGPPNFSTSSLQYYYPNGVAVRFALVLDRESNGSAPSSTDIWNYSAGGSSGYFITPRNKDYAGRYQVLWYKEAYMSPGALCPCAFSMYTTNKHTVEYKLGSTTATDADVWKGAISLWACCNTARNYDVQPGGGSVGSGQAFTFYINLRTVYEDV